MATTNGLITKELRVNPSVPYNTHTQTAATHNAIIFRLGLVSIGSTELMFACVE